jgi:thiamine-phosphate pyrophosphorylase
MLNVKSYPSEFFFTDSLRTPDVFSIVKSLPKGVGIVFRHYDHPKREYIGLKLSKLCKIQNRHLLVAKDFRLAKRLKAGLHLPEYLLNKVHKKDLGFFDLVTASAHSLSALTRAKKLGIRAAFLSPVYKTLSHKNQKPLGQQKLFALAQLTSLPIYALGGINKCNKGHLKAHKNIIGVGGIGLFLKKRSQKLISVPR